MVVVSKGVHIPATHSSVSHQTLFQTREGDGGGRVGAGCGEGVGKRVYG